MTKSVEITFARSAKLSGGVAVLLVADGAKPGPAAEIADPGGVLAKALKVSDFKGKARASVNIVAPAASPAAPLR